MKARNSKVEEIYKKWNDDLYQKYIQLFPESEHTTIWDGVIDPVSYANNPFKVMFLNKEAYDEEGNNYDVSKDLCSKIEAEQRIFPNQTALRTHLKQYLCVLQSCDRENFSKISDEAMRERVAKQVTDEKWFNTKMAQVAYCNVKKSDGQSKSNVDDLHNYAKKGIDVLKEQIRFFNPSIILAGNVCDGILEDLVDWGENLYIAEDRSICIWQIKIDGKYYPFVDMYHPSNVQGMSEYYLNLLHALQAVEKMNPYFWMDRYSFLCFDMNIALTKEDLKESVSQNIQIKEQNCQHVANHEAAELFGQGQIAAEKKDWKTAIKLWHDATEMDYAPAFREIGKFYDEIYYKEEGLSDDEFFDDYYFVYLYSDCSSAKDWYYSKAAELGDEESQFIFAKDHMYGIVKLAKIAHVVGYAQLNIFKAVKESKRVQREAELAVRYMNKLIQKQYEPALKLLEEWKQQASDKSDDYQYFAKSILEHLNF